LHGLAGKRRNVAEPFQEVGVVAAPGMPLLPGDRVQFVPNDIGSDTHSEHRRLRIQTFHA